MAKQLSLPLRRRGGRRPGAGRKPTGTRSGTAHRPRATFRSRKPVLVTKRLLRCIPSLRQPGMFRKVREAIERTNWRGLVKVIHWAVMGNHIHLIVEADSSDDLRRGLQGLWIRLARLLNGILGREGPVFADRFHSRVLGTPREVRNAIQYVLLNARKHGLIKPAERRLDPYSSAPSFDGWRRRLKARRTDSPQPQEPRTWLLRVGWRRHGRIDPAHVPG